MAFLYLSVVSVVVLAVALSAAQSDVTRPNIVFIVADDLGWDDVSFHGSAEVLTPNIDMLAYTGISLNRHYSHCVCTPSRSALLTGKFAHTMGMHGYPLTNGEDRGLPLSEKLLPEYLKELGYTNHLVGKWHVGMSRTKYLPTSRGFDSHFGFRGGFVDYYEYILEETWAHGRVSGFDLYRNLTPAWDVSGYLTDVFTDEAVRIIQNHNMKEPLFLMVSHSAPHSANDGALLQAPPEDVRSMRFVESPQRRIFAAMMKRLDKSVGDIFNALAERDALDDTIIVFITDNGGMPTGLSVNFASNFPLKGSKFTPFEGGIRTTGLVWTSKISSAYKVFDSYIHVVDWLPTLLRAAGAEIPKDIDGVDLWLEITTDKPSKRQEFFEIYTYGEDSFSSVVSGDYKLIVGNITPEYSSHFEENSRGYIGVWKPPYKSALGNSTVYKVLSERGVDFDLNEIESYKRDVHIDCDFNSNDDLSKAERVSNQTGGFYSALYNIKKDPCEIVDISKLEPDIKSLLTERLQKELLWSKNRTSFVRDQRAAPSTHEYEWTTWADEIEF